MKNYSESRNYNGEFSLAKRLQVKIQLVDKDERIGKRWRLISLFKYIFCAEISKKEILNFLLMIVIPLESLHIHLIIIETATFSI
jgi:hypothetical protein